MIEDTGLGILALAAFPCRLGLQRGLCLTVVAQLALLLLKVHLKPANYCDATYRYVSEHVHTTGSPQST